MGGHVRPRSEVIAEAVDGCRQLVGALDARSEDRMKLAGSLQVSFLEAAADEIEDAVLAEVIGGIGVDLAYYDAEPSPEEAAELIDDDELRARLQAALAQLEKLTSEP